jgi:anti-sigma regulatory factor (Ser/Thr protein kinase)
MDIIFSANISELPNMLGWIRERLSHLPMNKTDKRKVELALEEALVNIIRYAYKSCDGKITIEYKLSSNHAVVFRISDQGSPFNPLKKVSKIDRKVPLDKRKLGGLGIPFIFELMDEISYERKGHSNILCLEKKF